MSVADQDKISLWHAWGYASVLSCGGLLYGIDQGGLSGFLAMPAQAKIFEAISTEADTADHRYTKQFGTYNEHLHKYAVSANYQLALNFVALGGAVLAAVSAGEITSRFGRRIGMLIFCLCGVLGAVIQLAAATIGTILGGKFFIGCCFGLGTMVSSLYISETAPTHLRGSMVSLLLLTISLGSMIGSGVNWITHLYPNSWAYRGPFIAELILPALLFFAVFLVPESPRRSMSLRQGTC